VASVPSATGCAGTRADSQKLDKQRVLPKKELSLLTKLRRSLCPFSFESPFLPLPSKICPPAPTTWNHLDFGANSGVARALSLRNVSGWDSDLQFPFFEGIDLEDRFLNPDETIMPSVVDMEYRRAPCVQVYPGTPAAKTEERSPPMHNSRQILPRRSGPPGSFSCPPVNRESVCKMYANPPSTVQAASRGGGLLSQWTEIQTRSTTDYVLPSDIAPLVPTPRSHTSEYDSGARSEYIMHPDSLASNGHRP